MKNLQIISNARGGGGARTGRGGVGWDESKKSKLIPALWCGAKILLYPHPTTFVGRRKLT